MEIFDFEKLYKGIQLQIMEQYLDYLETHRKANYSDTAPTTFEDYLYNDYFRCEGCGEWRNAEEKGKSELALSDHVCIFCMNDGYGR